MNTHRFFRRQIRDIVGAMLHQAAAAVGWMIALFALFNFLGEFLRPGFDANFLWMPLSPTDGWGTRLIIGMAAGMILWGLLRPVCGAVYYCVTQAFLLFLVLAALWDCVLFYYRLAVGEIHSVLPVPFTSLAVFGLGMQIWRVHKDFRKQGNQPRCGLAMRTVTIGIGIAVVWIVFLWGQLYLAGSVSSTHKADCIIVMGAGVLWDGSPSPALRDRTITGCELYLSRRAKTLVFSGGPVSDFFSEPRAMSRIAQEMGISREATLLDEDGVSTWETVHSTRRIMQEHGWRNAILVTHDYHLSRTCLAFRRAGVEVFPVRARRIRVVWGKEIFNLFRETCAWTFYYFRPLWSPLQ